jgi:predicted ester cyclase
MPAGRDGLKALFRMIRQAMPDMVMIPEDIVAEGNRVTIRAVMTGTQTGEFMSIPPSGKHVEITVMDLDRIENNQFAEHWGVGDMMTLLTQIGAIPAPGTV